MSCSAAHESKTLRKNCEACQARKARFRFRGEVRADRDHTLCFECYRAARDRRRAQQLAAVERPRALRSPFLATPTLSERQITHRRAMLAHLRSAVR